MGDPLSVASGIAGLLSIAGLIFSRTYKFAKAAKGAESSIQTLADEVRTLAGLLQSLSLVAIELETGPIDSAFQLPHVISCQQVLLKIERRTREADPSNLNNNKGRAFMKKLKWPFSSGETMELIEEIARHQRLMTVALSADSISHLQQLLSGQEGILKGIRDIQGELERRRMLETRIALDMECQKVLQFFGRVDPTMAHETNRGLRHRQTGLWLLSHEIFLAWTRNMRSQLWLSGIPGAGKTVLASVVIEEMLDQSTPEKAVAYFYCDYKDEQRQKLPNILGTIACQIARQDASERSFGLLHDYYKSCHTPDKFASIPESTKLLDIIRDMSSSFEEVSIVVDALDECVNDRREVVEVLASLNDDILSNIRTAFLSRDESDIKYILDDFMHIPIAAHNDDLRIFVAEEIEARIQKRKLRIRNPGLKKVIMDKLIHGADGMFRWVACQLDYLCTLPHDRARREALSSLPPDLSSTYERILGRVANQPSSTQRIVRDTLLWTMHATEPLEIEALCEALSVNESATSLDSESRPDEEDILEYCSSLLRKEVGGSHLELAHFTVQEYLRSDALKNNQRLAFFYKDQQGCTAYLANVCLRYLNCDDYSRPPVQDYRKWRDFNNAHPFRSHATTEWDIYASNHQDNQDIRDQLQIFFHPLKPFQFLNWAQNFAATALHESHLRPREVFSKMSSTVTTSGISPLHFAAMLRSEWVMELLLNDGADVNKSSQIGTPLHCALLGKLSILGQFTGLSQMELIDARSQDQSIRGILGLLFLFDADPALLYRDYDGQHYNALSIAIETGNARREMFMCPETTACLNQVSLGHLEFLRRNAFVREIVECFDPQRVDPLLKTRVDELVEDFKSEGRYQDSDEGLGSTAEMEWELSFHQALDLDAVGRLDELLQERPEIVNGTIPGEKMAALHLAAYSNSVGAANLLIALGADIEAQDGKGQTAMHLCGYRNSTNVLRLLIGKGASSAKADNEGQTIWHVAAAQNNVDLLRTLLTNCPTATNDLSITDSRGWSPCFSAAEAGSEEALLLLSQHTNAFEGRTEDGLELAHLAVALSLSAFESLVKCGMDISTKIDNSPSLLHFLVRFCPLGSPYLANVKEKICCLVDHGLSVGATNGGGRTPLHALLSRRSWEVNFDYISNNVPLSPSSSFSLPSDDDDDDDYQMTDIDFYLDLPTKRFFTLVKALATKDTINLRDHNGVTALEYFCSHLILEEKHPKILRTINELGADITVKCSHGKAPLQVLFETHESDRSPIASQILPDLLLFMIDRLDASDETFKPPLGARILYWAVENESLGLIKKILEKGVSPAWRIPERGYYSALDCACTVSMSVDILRSLLDVCHTETRNRTHPRTGRNLLHILCSIGSVAKDAELMKLCISMGLDFESRDTVRGDTPLLLAIRNTGYNKANLARSLVESGAKTSVCSAAGESLAELAAMSGQLEALEIVDSIGALEGSPSWTARRNFHGNGGRILSLHGYNIWHLSAYSGSETPDALRYLFDHGHVRDIDGPTSGGTTALHITAYFGHTAALKYLVSIRADLNIPDRNGATALHYAAETGEVESINILVSAGANIHAVTSEGNLALHYAASHGQDGVVDALLDLGSPYSPNKKHETPYLAARLSGHESTALVLQDHEVSNTEGKSFQQALTNTFKIAVVRGDVRLCRKLLKQKVRADTVHGDCEACTPVCVAFAQNDPEMVKVLVRYRFPVNGRLCTNTKDPGLTPTLLALKNRNEELLHLALKDSTWQGSLLKDNLIFAAVYFQDHQCLKTLLNRVREYAHNIRAKEQPTRAAESSSTCQNLELNPNTESLSLSSMLDAQVRVSDLEWVKEKTFGKKAKIKSKKAGKLSALHLAAALDDKVSTELLLQYGATVDVVNHVGGTPLHYAAGRSCLDLASCLIQHGANVDGRDGYLQTVAMTAACNNALEILEMLHRCGANFSLRDIFGNDLLSYSCRSSAAVLAFVLSKGYRPTLNHRGTSPMGSALRSVYPGVSTLALNSVLAFDHAANLSCIALRDMIREKKPSLLRKLIRHASPSATPFPISENAKLDNIASVLHVAASSDRPDMLDILLLHGADIDFHAETEGTSLIAACSSGRFSSVKLLVRRGAAISYCKDGKVWSGVEAAKRFPEIVAWLLCGRFTSQKTLSHRAHPDTMDKSCGLWTGIEELEIPLSGELRRRWKESLLEQCIRISQFRTSRLGTVWEGIC